MSNEKMREEFESWYLTEYFEGDKDCGLEWLSTEPCGSYRYERPSTQWKIWQASRAAIEVELPDPWFYPQQEYKLIAQDLTIKAIESLGLKVRS